MRRIALQGTFVLALVVLVGVVGPALASPQPIPVCGACGSSFEDVAEDHGVTLDVSASTATVRVHENGSATWNVTNRVDRSAADRLATAPDLREGIARDVVRGVRGLPYIHRGSVEYASASVDDRTVTIQFLQRDAADRHAGLLVADALHSGGVRGGWILNTDRFAIVGPPGTEVVNDPSEAIDGERGASGMSPEVDGRRVSWRGTTGQTSGASFYDDLYVVYGSPETNGLHADVAVALATAPIWYDNVGAYVLPGVILYGLLLTGSSYAVRRDGDGDVDRLGAFVVVLGVLGILGAVSARIVGEAAWFGGVGAVYLVSGAVAVRRPDGLGTRRGTLALAAGSLLAAGLLVHVVAMLGPASGQRLDGTVVQTAYHLPVAVAPAFGLAVARAEDRESARETASAFVGAGASFSIAALVFVPAGSTPFGIVFLLFTVGGAIVASLLSVPLAVLAARVRASDRDGETGGETVGIDD